MRFVFANFQKRKVKECNMDFSNLVGKVASGTELVLTDAEVQAISAFYDVLCLIALLLLVNIALTVFRSFRRNGVDFNGYIS